MLLIILPLSQSYASKLYRTGSALTTAHAKIHELTHAIIDAPNDEAENRLMKLAKSPVSDVSNGDFKAFMIYYDTNSDLSTWKESQMVSNLNDKNLSLNLNANIIVDTLTPIKGTDNLYTGLLFLNGQFDRVVTVKKID